MNPEKLLEEVANAIKHRCISTTHRWSVVYYHNRICCVPSYENFPPEIFIAEFNEQMVQDGFTTLQWETLKQNIIEIYKELHK